MLSIHLFEKHNFKIYISFCFYYNMSYLLICFHILLNMNSFYHIINLNDRILYEMNAFS